MTIAQIYKKYHITQTLQEHMLSVAAIAAFIADHWTEAPLDRNLLATSLLLHDLGNLVKFDLKNQAHLLGAEEKNLAKWKKTQKNFIKKYGKDAHKATLKILKKLKINDDRVAKINSLLGPAGIHQVADGHNWHFKIAYYADGRVSPSGLVSLKERFDDLQKRYARRPEWQPKATQERYRICLEIERKLQAHCKQNLAEIEETDLDPYLAQLKLYQIS
jgi:HD domain-containing protein